jgi:hypothetical protein
MRDEFTIVYVKAIAHAKKDHPRWDNDIDTANRKEIPGATGEELRRLHQIPVSVLDTRN